MRRTLFTLAFGLLLAACGSRQGHPFDAGPDMDGGDDGGVDAGRPRGEDPPTGYSTALPLPQSSAVTLRVGVSAAVAADQYGQPMVAAIDTDPNGDGNPGDTQVVFTRWNGTSKTYETPVNLSTVGDVDVTEPSQQVALTRDPASGVLYAVFVTQDKEVKLASSDNEGVAWSLTTVSDNPGGHLLWNPSVAARGGTVHVAYQEADARCAGTGCADLVCRMKTGSGSFGAKMIMPIPTGYDGVVVAPYGFAVDGTGASGVVAAFEQTAGLDVAVAFWRPGTSTTTVIATSGGTDNSTADKRASASLAFDGTGAPRAAYHLLTTAPDTQLWYAAAASPDGMVWGAPVAIPRNGAGSTLEGTRWYQALAIDTSGKLAIGAYHASSPVQQQCTGGPKLARSTDGNAWTVCRPDTGGSVGTFGFAGEWIHAGYYAPGKVMLGFTYENRNNPSVQAGVVLWREP